MTPEMPPRRGDARETIPRRWKSSVGMVELKRLAYMVAACCGVSVLSLCIPTRDDAIQSFLWYLAYIALAVSAIPDKYIAE